MKNQNRTKTWKFNESFTLKIKVLKEAKLWSSIVEELKESLDILDVTETSMVVNKTLLVDDTEFYDLVNLAFQIIDSKYKELVLKIYIYFTELKRFQKSLFFVYFLSNVS